MKKDLALNIQSHYVQEIGDMRKRVTWARVEGAGDRERNDDVRFTDYMAALRNRDFSILMNDGGVIQLSLAYEGRTLVGHRHVYIPCPIHFENADLRIGDEEIFPLEDFLEDFIINIDADGLQNRLRVRSPFRFEYDPGSVTEGHPSSHVHFGKSSSRVPVSSPITAYQFLRFVFRNFYPDEFEAYDEIGCLNSPAQADTITMRQSQELHIRVRR